MSGNERQLVTQTRGLDELGTHVGGNGDEEVEGDLPLIPGLEHLALIVHLGGVELADHVDLPILEQVAESLGGDGLGEGTIQRCHIGDLDLISDAFLLEEGLGQEGDLQGCHRAFDGHLDHVDGDLAAFELGQSIAQSHGTFEGVEIKDALLPFLADQTFGLFGSDVGARGDDKKIVGEVSPPSRIT